MQDIQTQIRPQPQPQPQPPVQAKPSSNRLFDNLFILLCFLIPIALFPGSPALLFVSKLILISSLGALLLILLLLNILGTGGIEWPRTKLIFGLLLLPLAALVSALFSGSITNSIIGTVFEVGTASSLILLSILFLLALVAGLKEAVIKRTVWVFLVSMGLSVIYTIFVTAMQYGWIPAINGLPFSLVGSYIDFSILLSVAIIMCLYLLNFREALGTKTKIALWVLLLLSLTIIGATGFRPVFVMLGIFSLLIFVYLISVFRNYGSSWIKKSYSTLIVLAASAILVISGSFVSGYLSRTLKINSFDVRPNTLATFGIIKNQWKINAITGSGPNRFTELWALYRPLEVNQSNFWNADFFFGIGLVPTLGATTGILGLAAIAVFLFIITKKGLEVFFASTKDNNTRFISVFMFLAGIFLWVAMFIYTPGLSVLSLAFIFMGLFTASLTHAGILQNVRINIFRNPKANFFSVFLLVVLMVGIVSAEYFVWEKITASIIFNKAVNQFNIDGDDLRARASIEKAESIYATDTYERSLSELHLLSVEKIVASIPQDGTQIPEDKRVLLQQSVANAVALAKSAILKDPGNYINYLTIARIYESLAQKGIQGAAESAKESLAQAEKLNPLNPSIQLSYARLGALSGDIEAAKRFVNKAIELKWNYTNAYFLLAQLEAAFNNVPGAIKAVESATLVDPGNAGLYFQLGLLKYQINDNPGAVQAFERALTIVPDYANAKYFLGISYYKLRRFDDAVNQFEDIKKTNPLNKEVDLILGNLKAKKDPFTGAEPPLDSKPEKRKNPPIEESSAKAQSNQ